MDTKSGHIFKESTFSKPSVWVSILVFCDVHILQHTKSFWQKNGCMFFQHGPVRCDHENTPLQDSRLESLKLWKRRFLLEMSLIFRFHLRFWGVLPLLVPSFVPFYLTDIVAHLVIFTFVYLYIQAPQRYLIQWIHTQSQYIKTEREQPMFTLSHDQTFVQKVSAPACCRLAGSFC